MKKNYDTLIAVILSDNSFFLKSFLRNSASTSTSLICNDLSDESYC